MKRLIVFWFVISGACSFGQSPLIHTHNDYQKPKPLFNALRNKAYSVEADVYLHEGKLLVAHDPKDLSVARSLEELYIRPIIELYRKNKGFISGDMEYAPVLMIDIKDNGKEVIEALVEILSPHRTIFDRSINKHAVQIVLSGERGAIERWTSYPSFIYFDGRPYEAYDSATLEQVAFISDNWFNYKKLSDSGNAKIQMLVKKVHALGKKLRLWASPDTPASWELQRRLGIDIINTDKVAECRKYFENKVYLKAESIKQ